MSLSLAFPCFDPARLLPLPRSLALHGGASGLASEPHTASIDPLELVRRLALEAVSSPLTREAYGRALDEFSQWREESGHPRFTRAAVHAWRASLEAKGYAPATINQKLAAVRKLAKEAAKNGWLDGETAAQIEQVSGAKQSGQRSGNWLTRRQAQALLDAPAPTRSRASATCAASTAASALFPCPLG